jgi:hypothetical protein
LQITTEIALDNELGKVEVIARVTGRRRLAFFAGLHGTMGASKGQVG